MTQTYDHAQHGTAAGPPPRTLIAQEVLSRITDLAGDPPASDMLALPDGVAVATAPADDLPGLMAEIAEDLEDWRAELREAFRSGEGSWQALTSLAFLRVAGASRSRELRRALVDLAAYAVWWAEAIENRPASPSGALPAPGAEPPACTCIRTPHALDQDG